MLLQLLAGAVQGHVLEGPGDTIWHFFSALAAAALSAAQWPQEGRLAGPAPLSDHLGRWETDAALQDTLQTAPASNLIVSKRILIQLNPRVTALLHESRQALCDREHYYQ